MEQQPVTAIIVGAGHRAFVYSKLALTNPELLKIVGVADPDPIRRKKAMDMFGFPEENCFENADALSRVPKFADTIINEKGIIYGYKKSNYNLDHVNPGKILFRLYEREQDPRYKIAMDTLRSQLASQPRTSEGGFWHKRVYPFQMWLDGIYMGEPYYAQYTATFDADNEAAYADIVNQFLLVAKRTYDKETGLYRHAWDEIKALPWSDKSGRSAHVWGRALGWYMMAIVDALDYLPQDQPGRDKIITILQGIVKNLAKYQDPQTGAWCQVIDQTGREGNYLEMSCTPMYAYAIAKGVRKGYLDPSTLEMAKKATRAQFAQYGMANVPDDLLEKYASDMLKDKKIVSNIAERATEEKIIETIKSHVSLNEKNVSVEDFYKMFENK